jgi:hypothetical protein
MSLKKVAGSRLYIGPRVQYKTVISPADFVGLSWTWVRNLTQAPSTTTETAVLSQTLVDQAVTLYGKGVRSFATMQAQFVPDYADPGQVAMLAAHQSRCGVYAVKLEWDADCASESVVTISQATPGVVTWNAHGLAAGTPIIFSTTGTLPTGLLPGVTYYVVETIATNTFSVAATPGGAAINTTGAGSGVHTARALVPGETDLHFALIMLGEKSGGDAGANRLLTFGIQPVAEYITV